MAYVLLLLKVAIIENQCKPDQAKYKCNNLQPEEEILPLTMEELNRICKKLGRITRALGTDESEIEREPHGGWKNRRTAKRSSGRSGISCVRSTAACACWILLW